MLDYSTGFVNTTNACNFFHRPQGEGLDTSNWRLCMNGITRQKVINLCRANDIPLFRAELFAGPHLWCRRGIS